MWAAPYLVLAAGLFAGLFLLGALLESHGRRRGGWWLRAAPRLSGERPCGLGSPPDPRGARPPSAPIWTEVWDRAGRRPPIPSFPAAPPSSAPDQDSLDGPSLDQRFALMNSQISTALSSLISATATVQALAPQLAELSTALSTSKAAADQAEADTTAAVTTAIADAGTAITGVSSSLSTLAASVAPSVTQVSSSLADVSSSLSGTVSAPADVSASLSAPQ
ncbi:MAG: hypothetical protein P4L73_19745 [Caulobacteraceae bacterium]|nr:hypothetical protein [Caulobacteraceae bacterium]